MMRWLRWLRRLVEGVVITLLAFLGLGVAVFLAAFIMDSLFPPCPAYVTHNWLYFTCPWWQTAAAFVIYLLFIMFFMYVFIWFIKRLEVNEDVRDA